MLGGNPDAPTNPLADIPAVVDNADLMDVDATGVPIYFDEANARAFEALESDSEWVVGEERTNADLASIVADIS